MASLPSESAAPPFGPPVRVIFSAACVSSPFVPSFSWSPRTSHLTSPLADACVVLLSTLLTRWRTSWKSCPPAADVVLDLPLSHFPLDQPFMSFSPRQCCSFIRWFKSSVAPTFLPLLPLSSDSLFFWPDFPLPVIQPPLTTSPDTYAPRGV